MIVDGNARDGLRAAAPQFDARRVNYAPGRKERLYLRNTPAVQVLLRFHLALALAAFAGCAAIEETSETRSETAKPPPVAVAPDPIQPRAEPPAPDRTPRPIAVPKPTPLVEPVEEERAKPATAMATKPGSATIATTVLFEYKKSELTPQAKEALDRDIVSRLPGFARVELISLTGHADRIAPRSYNMTLSRARAQAVKAYLVANGAGNSLIAVYGFGESQPVKACPDGGSRKQLIGCLAPNRRVVVQVKGLLK